MSKTPEMTQLFPSSTTVPMALAGAPTSPGYSWKEILVIFGSIVAVGLFVLAGIRIWFNSRNQYVSLDSVNLLKLIRIYNC